MPLLLGRNVGCFHISSCLADSIAKVIELSASNLAVFGDHNFSELRRVELKNTLNPFPTGNFPHRQRLVQAGTLATDYDSFENLNPLLTTFDNAVMHFNSVTRTKAGHFIFHLLALDFINHVHGNITGVENKNIQSVSQFWDGRQPLLINLAKAMDFTNIFLAPQRIRE